MKKVARPSEGYVATFPYTFGRHISFLNFVKSDSQTLKTKLV